MSEEVEEEKEKRRKKKKRTEMTDRFFPNEMPDFVEEREGGDASSLGRLLSLPYPKLSEKLLKAGLDLKEKVVKETWVRTKQRVNDYTLYTGSLGTAFLLFKSYQVTKNETDLALSGEIIKACDSASKGLPFVTFICGRAGVCALGAVVSKLLKDEALANHYLNSFNQINLPDTVPNELLYGRAGYIWACSFLNNHLGKNTIPPHKINPLVNHILKDGKRLSSKLNHKSPVMYEWHGKHYWGSAHGLAGIMQVLMDADLGRAEREDVKATLDYMIKNRFPGGNYPSSEGNTDDRLVHWCHGAPGVSLTLSKAYEVFKEERFLHAASDAGEVVWNRGLLKRVGICHGISGNAYTFLSLYRRTGNLEYLYRAKAFACFLLDKGDKMIGEGVLHTGDRPFSLFEGQAGMAYLFLDMVKPGESRFPGYEL
ncbi:hypothetical protein LUZ60_014810 [Juncus effusus]|nr:hypothetical protein LUZ60_014810 [Juncus effusus]